MLLPLKSLRKTCSNTLKWSFLKNVFETHVLCPEKCLLCLETFRKKTCSAIKRRSLFKNFLKKRAHTRKNDFCFQKLFQNIRCQHTKIVDFQKHFPSHLHIGSKSYVVFILGGVIYMFFIFPYMFFVFIG